MKITKLRSSGRGFWQPKILDWQQSGLSGAQYCKNHKLVYHQFLYWRQQCPASGEPAARPLPSPPSGFAEVQLQGEGAEALGLSIMLPSGLALRGITAANLPVVVKLLEAL